jgi:hypothetical protein
VNVKFLLTNENTRKFEAEVNINIYKQFIQTRCLKALISGEMDLYDLNNKEELGYFLDDFTLEYMDRLTNDTIEWEFEENFDPEQLITYLDKQQLVNECKETVV